ncbi:MAG: hypothetical protein II956_16880 [Bacteroidales bacterium]|nr:hypothetical protein [Bacteroidales bacterium]
MRKFSILLLSTLIIVLTMSSSSIAKDIDTIPKNCISGVFSVSKTKKVYFSKGNLQYHCKNNEWRFAPNQCDRIGDDNKNISADYDGYIDLFGWGTWLKDDNPLNISEIGYDYTYDHTKKSAIGSEWITLTKDEWEYLKGRKHGKKIGVAEVGGVQGLVILPDDWTLPNGVEFKSGFAENFGEYYYKNKNNYTTKQWESMEANGAVFLPAAGLRYGSEVGKVGIRGYYWWATYGGTEGAFFLNFGSDGADLDKFCRSYGQSVRLVRVF